MGIWGVLGVALLGSCASPTPGPSHLTPTATLNQTQSLPLASATPCGAACETPTATPYGPLGPFATPALPAPTAVPDPVDRLRIPEDVQSVVLLGAARTSAFDGRTNAVTLLFFNARTAKASVVSLPPMLYVYLPGYTMQRLNVAYPVGGIDMVQQTLAYNFGVRPDWWALAHLDDFPALIDDLGGLDITVLTTIKTAPCTFSPGDAHLNGALALCYARVLPAGDELARMRRQQDLLRAAFLKLVGAGNLIHLPDLYQKYQGMIQTNLGVDDLQGFIPLALKLGDPGRIAYYQVSSHEIAPWQLPQSQTSVLLPQRDALQPLLQAAVDSVSVPAPLTDRVSTLVAELTLQPTPTITPIYTATPAPSPTPRYTPTPTSTLTPTGTLTPPTSTPTITPTGTITPPTATPTGTITPPTPTPTGSLTITPSDTPTETETPTPSPSPT